MSRPERHDSHGWTKSDKEMSEEWRSYALDQELEVARLKQLVESLADRVAVQAEMLSKQAERK